MRTKDEIREQYDEVQEWLDEHPDNPNTDFARGQFNALYWVLMDDGQE